MLIKEIQKKINKDTRFLTYKKPSNKAASLARQKLRDSKYFFQNRFITEKNDYETIINKKSIFATF